MTTADARGLASLSQPWNPFQSTATTIFPTCTWEGHCLGAACLSENDCDRDWVCLNGICSPCCITPVPSVSSGTLPSSVAAGSTTPAAVPTASAASESSDKGLSTGAAIGIGVGIVLLLALVAGSIFGIWFFRRRRQQNPPGEPLPSVPPSPLNPPISHYPDERKYLMSAARPVEEMPDSSKPTEVHAESLELIELEGDTAYRDKKNDSPATTVEQTATLPPYRFEEYVVSPVRTSSGDIALSPVSASQSNTTASRDRAWTWQTQRDGEQANTCVAGEGDDGAYTLWRWPDARRGDSNSNSPR